MDHYSSNLNQPAGSSLNLALNNMGPPMDQHQQIDAAVDHQMLNLATQNQTNKYMNSREKILMYQLNQYYITKATQRSKNISKTIQEVVKIVHDVLRELEAQEPRFISTFTETNGYYDG